MQENTAKVSSAAEEYAKKRPVYLAFTKKLKLLLIDLLDDEKIDYHSVERRAKRISSFVDKAREKGYASPMREITDLSGLRVIVHYLDEVPRVSDIIEREFTIDRKNSLDKSALMKPDQFGYLSVQYVVSLSNQRFSLIEWQDFRGLKAEIQIRTLPQHVWAAINHKLQYKKEAEVPYALRRRLYRIAAQLELVDEQFQDVRDELTSVKTYPETPVSKWTLAHFCESSTRVREIEIQAERAGFAASTDDKENTGELAEACEKTGIVNLAQLEEFLTKLTTRSRRFLQALVALGGRRDSLAGPMLLTLMLLYARYPQKFTRRYLKAQGWNRRGIDNLLRAAKKSRFSQPVKP